MLDFYRKVPAKEVPPEERNGIKVWIKHAFEQIVIDEDFFKNVFDKDIFLKLNENEYMGIILTIMKDCAIELFNKMIEEKLHWNFDIKYTFYIAIACLSIAIKNIGAHDWLNNDNIILSQIIKALNKVNKKNVIYDLIICKKIEIDIFKITEWKGCNMYDLKKDYTDYFDYTKTEDKFDIPDEIISSELSKTIKAIIDYEKKMEDSKPKRLPLPLPKPKKSPSPKSPKKSPSPKSPKKSPSKAPKKSPSPKSPKAPKKSPSKSAFKKKKRV